MAKYIRSLLFSRCSEANPIQNSSKSLVCFVSGLWSSSDERSWLLIDDDGDYYKDFVRSNINVGLYS